MSINVKNAELVEMIRTGAAAEGIGQTAYIRRAVEMRMAHHDSVEARRRHRAKTLAAELAERLRDKDLDRAAAEAEIYDEDGLPQ